MPNSRKRKLSNNDFEVLSKKLKKLEEKIESCNHRRRARIVESTSSSSSSRESTPVPENKEDGETTDARIIDDILDIQSTLPQPSTSHCRTDEDSSALPNQDTSQEGSVPTQTDTELDSILLDILGDDPNASPEHGQEIQKELACRFEHICTKGLNKESRKELNSKYLTPANCVRSAAPMMNAEIKAALSEALIKRDKAIEARQKQLSSAISSLGGAMTKMFAAKERDRDILKQLMDTSRILCDLQHTESITRRNFAVYALKKDMKEHLSSTQIDKYLFSESLPDALKTAKAVCKTGIDLKVKADKKSSQSTAPHKSTAAKNWKPPGGTRRPPPPQRSREPAHRTAPKPAASSKTSPRPQRSTHRR